MRAILDPRLAPGGPVGFASGARAGSLIITMIVACATPAAASPYEGSAAIEIGDLPFGAYDGGGLGMRVDGGRRWDRLMVAGELGFLDEDGKLAGSTDSVRGYGGRLGVSARYDLLRDRLSEGAMVDLTLDAGVGEEYLRWARGGSIHRPDLAFGFTADARLQHGGHVLGFSAGLEFLFGHSPIASSGGPRCGGPCYAPSTPLTWDLGVLYVIGFKF